MASVAEEWVRAEDEDCREGRVSRLEWLIAETPTDQNWAFHGSLSHPLFDEMRHSFVYGESVATILLGLAYIEHTLAAVFYGRGLDDLERAPLSELLTEARSDGTIDAEDFRALDRIRKSRNTYVHFRPPAHEDGIAARVVRENDSVYDIIERDARDVIRAALRMVGRGWLT